jgi:mono/diheme cytochrome c family protein
MTVRRAALVALAVSAALALAAPAPAAAEDAPKIFAKSCSPCHGKEGEPSAVFAKQGVRSFKDQVWQKAAPDAQIEKSIREGKKGTMMASFEKQFSAEEIKALVAHIRKLGGVSDTK